MNGDRKALDASQLPSTIDKEVNESLAQQQLEISAAGQQTGKRRRRKDRQRALDSNRLSVGSSDRNKSKPDPTRLEATDCRSEQSGTDADSISQFTTTSEITTDDDAASIEIRLKQLVVEQEEKLELDDRYKSTPVLAARHCSPRRLNLDDSKTDNTVQNDWDGSGIKAGCGTGSEPIMARAKSTNDLQSTGMAHGGNLDHSTEPTNVAADQVPDVFVSQVDDGQRHQQELKDDSDRFAADERQCYPDENANMAADINNPQRARALSIASGSPTVLRRPSATGSEKGDILVTVGSMRRHVSSSLLGPERGNLRSLNNNRAGSGQIGESDRTAISRLRSNTAGSMNKAALFGVTFNHKTPADADQSMLSIRRSAWTLSDFDQTFNKSALAEQQRAAGSDTCGQVNGGADQQQHQKLQQHQLPAISDTPRGSTGSDRQSTSLLIKASKNALAGFNQHQQSDNMNVQIRQPNLGLSVANNTSDRRPSFSHSIVSIPSSVDSYTNGKLAPPFNRKHQPSLSAKAGNGDDQEGSCLRSCLNLATLREYLPILEWLPNYNRGTFYSDLGAGLVVVALNISTSLSAAVVAETDFGAAFRASIVNTFVYAILCSSKHASFGSWSIMSQMLLLSVKRALSDEFILDRLNMGPTASWEPEEYEKWHMNIIIMYTFLIGLVQLVCGALNLGNILSSFIPEALCSSMIAATAFTMAIGQLANMCGTSNKILWQIERNTTELWADLKDPPVDITDLFANTFRWIQQIILLVKHYDQINVVCVFISSISVILLFLNQYVIQQYLQKVFRRKILIPFEMVLLIVMISVSYYLELAENYNVTTCGPISIEFGIPNIPNLKLIRELWYNSLATALISYTMVYIMAKSYSNKLNYEVNYNQELIACGAGNLIGGLFDALPATASFSRTAGQVEAGGQTQMVSIINCILLVVLAKLLGQYVAVLPICVMSAALFFGFSRMMTRFTEVFMYWRVCKVDCAIWVVTFVAILAVDMVSGFIFGFIFSILTMLYRAQNRRCYMLGTIGSSDVYVPLVKYPMAQEIEGIKIFQFCGPIHYVCADLVERLLRMKTRINVKEVLRYISDQGIDKFNPTDIDLPTHIILDFSMISFIDSAGIQVIKKIIEDYQKINVTVLLASLASHVAAVVKSEPSLWNVYKQRFYITLADAVHCAARDRIRQTGIGARAECTLNSGK